MVFHCCKGFIRYKPFVVRGYLLLSHDLLEVNDLQVLMYRQVHWTCYKFKFSNTANQAVDILRKRKCFRTSHFQVVPQNLPRLVRREPPCAGIERSCFWNKEDTKHEKFSMWHMKDSKHLTLMFLMVYLFWTKLQQKLAEVMFIWEYLGNVFAVSSNLVVQCHVN